MEGLIVGVEICEDLWVPVPPSSMQCCHGATILTNLSASNETIGKASYRRQLVGNQSARCIAGYVYASAGVGESSTDLVFGGHCLIAENGALLAESPRYQRDDVFIAADVDLDRPAHESRHDHQFQRRGLGPSPPARIPPHSLPRRAIQGWPAAAAYCRSASVRAFGGVGTWGTLRGDLSDAASWTGRAPGAHRQAGRRHRRLGAASIRRWRFWSFARRSMRSAPVARRSAP